MKAAKRFLPLTALALALVGCGYGFPGQGTVLPGGGTKIHVRQFSNHTNDPGLVSGLQMAFESEVARRGVFEVTQAGRADVVLDGVILQLQVRPVAFSGSDEALQYETIVTVSAWLEDSRSNRVVWRIERLRENDSYGAGAQTVITQSSQFLEQSTLNEQNLQQLSDVQVSESQRTEALGRVYDNLARDMYNAMVENF